MTDGAASEELLWLRWRTISAALVTFDLSLAVKHRLHSNHHFSNNSAWITCIQTTARDWQIHKTVHGHYVYNIFKDKDFASIETEYVKSLFSYHTTSHVAVINAMDFHWFDARWHP